MLHDAPFCHSSNTLSSGLNPFGVAPLNNANLKSQQAYDLTVSLKMPPSPANTERGNFMVALYLLDSGHGTSTTGSAEAHEPPEPYGHFNSKTVLFRSRRPALVPYQDPLVSLAYRIMFLPYYLLASDAQVLALDVPMAQRVEIASHRGTLPDSAYVEIIAGQTLETYDASIIVTAQLQGLRWLMYHYRALSFVAATLTFWVAEMLFMFLAWLAWSRSAGGPQTSGESKIEGMSLGKSPLVKREEGEQSAFSEVPDDFHAYGGESFQRSGPGARDKFSGPREHAQLPEEGAQPPGAEADDEAEDIGRAAVKADSGLGTSYSEDTTGSVRRRPSHRRLT